MPSTGLPFRRYSSAGSVVSIHRDPCSAVLDSPPLSGTLALAPAGAFTYTPTAGFLGTDAFRYHADDGSAASNSATVTLTVRVPLAFHRYLPVVLKP